MISPNFVKKIYKLEIIDNTITNCYRYNVLEWKFKNWWSREKSWNLVEGHTLGKKYMCPEIHLKIKTVEDLFQEDLGFVKKRYTFNEIHNTVISSED